MEDFSLEFDNNVSGMFWGDFVFPRELGILDSNTSESSQPEDTHTDTEKQARAKSKGPERLPYAARKDMDSWLFAHVNNPYPSELEKMTFAMKHRISKKKVETYMTNQRRRLLKRGKRDTHNQGHLLVMPSSHQFPNSSPVAHNM